MDRRFERREPSPQTKERKGGKTKKEGVPDLGKRITDFMGTELKLSDLSAKSGISPSYLSRIVNGEVTNPTIDFAMRISRGLGITVSELIGETQKTPEGINRAQLIIAFDQLEEARNTLRNVIFDQSRQEELKTLPDSPQST